MSGPLNLDDPQPNRCLETKRGRFAKLRCIRERGHRGPCNFVSVGVQELERKPLGYRKGRKAENA